MNLADLKDGGINKSLQKVYIISNPYFMEINKMSRPFTDVGLAISGVNIKNGSVVVSATFTGQYKTLNTYAKNTPAIADIDDKYGNRFYNGIFVNVLPSGS